MPKIADRIRVMWCSPCDAYHLFLYCEGNPEPFGMCTLAPETMCDMIDADFGIVVEHPEPVMMLH